MLRRHSLLLLFLLSTTVSGLRKCTCSCPCKPDGTKLKDLINCFATWGKNVATDTNSNLEGCKEEDIIFCRTTNTFNKFCKFDGTNNLQETKETPECYCSCGVLSCNSWLVAHSPEQIDCTADLFAENKHLR